MASLKAAMKGHQKTHRERGQITGRKHLGLLEKHKDYKLRAKDFHRKENTIKALKKKAFEKNPDEFYFGMIKNKTKDGVHIKQRESKTYTADQIKLLKSQDLNYINLKRSAELKKIEKMQNNLHLLDVVDNEAREHLFFVDSKEEAKTFDAAEKFNTLPELLGRGHNVPTMDMLMNSEFDFNSTSTLDRKGKKYSDKSYKELAGRIKREQQLSQAREELGLQRQLMGKGRVHKRKNGNGRPLPVFLISNSAWHEVCALGLRDPPRPEAEELARQQQLRPQDL